MIEVELAKIIIDEKRHDQAVVLREKKGTRQVPIMIGIVEASSIQMKIANMEPPRPLTHDLLAEIIKSFGASLERVVIDDIIEGTFYAKLHLRDRQNNAMILDCRPSDGISLAIRLSSPMFVEDKILSQ